MFEHYQNELIKWSEFMSRGIEVYYKLVSIDKEKITYGYSGANINKEYELIKLLDYDGLIEIAIEALEKNKTLSEVFTNKEVNIIKECRYEWHVKKDKYKREPYFISRYINFA